MEKGLKAVCINNCELSPFSPERTRYLLAVCSICSSIKCQESFTVVDFKCPFSLF